MALRLFKKKDGSPTGLAKLGKGVFKTVAKVATFLPVPAGVSKLVDKIAAKIEEKTGLDASKVKIKAGETIAQVANRVQVGTGAAAAGFLDNVGRNSPENTNPLIFGYAKEKVLKALPLIGIGLVGLYFLLKKLRIL